MKFVNLKSPGAKVAPTLRAALAVSYSSSSKQALLKQGEKYTDTE